MEKTGAKPHRDFSDVLRREVEYHEELYSGEAQALFRKAAVKRLRRHMVDRIVRLCQISPQSRVLSLGCGIGDTELLLAKHCRELVGLDISPKGIEQARRDSEAAGVANTQFLVGSVEKAEGPFDAVIGIFFLHHLPPEMFVQTMAAVSQLLTPGGWFYSLDPNKYRLSGAVGKLIVPRLMRHYQTEDEAPLDPDTAKAVVENAGFDVRTSIYDFFSSPAAGLFPSAGGLYRFLRVTDDVLLKLPLIPRIGSNLEIVAQRCGDA